MVSSATALRLWGDLRRLDRTAHKGARRIAITGLAGLVLYWGVVFKLSQWTLCLDLAQQY